MEIDYNKKCKNRNINREKYIIFIYDHINELKPKFRKEILQMILCSISEDKVEEKNKKGTFIKFDHLNDQILLNINNYISNKLENNVLFL